LGATYTNEQGEEVPLVMGCYGVGVSRLVQSAVEQSYDKDGIIWPTAIVPYQKIYSCWHEPINQFPANQKS